MKYTYEIIEEPLRDSLTSFGIVVLDSCDRHKLLFVAHNCTSNLEQVRTFVDACNRLQPSRVHIEDIIDDFLG